jgi:ABC-type glycerol-3-phosphate transport system substrate-binding protein
VIVPAFIGLTEMLKASAAKDYTGQRFVDALTMYRRMVDDGVLDATDTGMAAADAEAMFVGGQAVMKPSASYDIGTLVALDPTISVFEEPVMLVDDPVVKYWGGAGQMYCVTAGTPNEQAAMDLLTWWVQPDQLGVQVEESGLVSSLRSANEAIDPDSLAGFAAARLDLVEEEGLFYNNYVPSAEAEAWGRAIQEVVSGAKSPEEAIETTVQAVFQG